MEKVQIEMSFFYVESNFLQNYRLHIFDLVLNQKLSACDWKNVGFVSLDQKPDSPKIP